uniref:DUF4371 domain-containing protein n=1 Tax=Trichuris muris TaxID=70415 RepID=A0A5S6QEN2_TRIMR
MKLDPEETVQAIPLSNSTVCRRIDEMAGDIEGQLICLLRSRRFLLQLDETTLQDSDALLMAYVRFFNAKELVEEMLFVRRIRTDTKGATIFEEVRGFFEENGILMENIIACATGGAASMVGRYRGLISYLKTVVPSVFTIHGVVHREHLVSKKLALRLNHSLSLVIQVINFITSHALQNRLFCQVCEENGEDFDTLLLHTEVRWLSKGNCLQRFVALWDSIVAFMSDKDFGEKLIDAMADIFYLADIFQKLDFVKQGLTMQRQRPHK